MTHLPNHRWTVKVTLSECEYYLTDFATKDEANQAATFLSNRDITKIKVFNADEATPSD